MRVADLIAYVNHDIDDAVRAGVMKESDLPPDAAAVLGPSSSARIARMVKDVVVETRNGDLSEIRMSDEVLEATLAMRAFLFDAVYENESATAEFSKAAACGRSSASGRRTFWIAGSSIRKGSTWRPAIFWPA
jgi:dGTPase